MTREDCYLLSPTDYVTYMPLSDHHRTLCYNPPYEDNYLAIMKAVRLEIEARLGRELNFRR